MDINNLILPKNIRDALKKYTSTGQIVTVLFPLEPSSYLHLGHYPSIYITLLIFSICLSILVTWILMLSTLTNPPPV